MTKFLCCFLVVGLSLLVLIGSCKHASHATMSADGDYPPVVSAIIMNKCAISGCHNAASYVKPLSFFNMDESDMYAGLLGES